MPITRRSNRRRVSHDFAALHWNFGRNDPSLALPSPPLCQMQPDQICLKTSRRLHRNVVRLCKSAPIRLPQPPRVIRPTDTLLFHGQCVCLCLFAASFMQTLSEIFLLEGLDTNTAPDDRARGTGRSVR